MFRNLRHHWRSFRPRSSAQGAYKGRNRKLDKQHTYQPQQVVYEADNTDVFDIAEQRVVSMIQRRPEIDNLDKRIEPLRGRFAETKQIQDGLAALLAQVPRAVLAQLQMDSFPRGYRNKQKRLFELIDFNDTLVSTILLMDDTLRCQFENHVKEAADRICKRVGAPCFTDEQWTSIIRGLTREVAVYLAALENGFEALLTDRVSDALGIDVQIRDPNDRRYINIDVKTPSSFRHRMEQLVHEARLSESELMEGDKRSYVVEYNGHGSQRTQIIVLCILPDLFGDLADWRFVNSGPMRDMINRLIREYGIADDKFGRYT